VWFPTVPEPHALRLLATLGVNVRLDPSARNGRLPGVAGTDVFDGIATAPCRIDGCPNTTEVLRGRYAKLCADHRAELAAEVSADHEAARRNGWKPNGRLDTVPPRETLETLARRVPPAAKRLEQAAGKRKAARAEARKAVEDFNSSLRQLQEAAKALLA